MLVAEVLLQGAGRVARERLPDCAVQDQLVAAVGDDAVDAGLEVPAGNVLGAGEVARGELFGAADVDDRHALADQLLDLGRVDLLDLALDTAEKLGSGDAHRSKLLNHGRDLLTSQSIALRVCPSKGCHTLRIVPPGRAPATSRPARGRRRARAGGARARAHLRAAAGRLPLAAVQRLDGRRLRRRRAALAAPAPDFTLRDQDGGTVSLQSLRGQPRRARLPVPGLRRELRADRRADPGRARRPRPCRCRW